MKFRTHTVEEANQYLARFPTLTARERLAKCCNLISSSSGPILANELGTSAHAIRKSLLSANKKIREQLDEEAAENKEATFLADSVP